MYLKGPLHVPETCNALRCTRARPEGHRFRPCLRPCGGTFGRALSWAEGGGGVGFGRPGLRRRGAGTEGRRKSGSFSRDDGLRGVVVWRFFPNFWNRESSCRMLKLFAAQLLPLSGPRWFQSLALRALFYVLRPILLLARKEHELLDFVRRRAQAVSESPRINLNPKVCIAYTLYIYIYTCNM